MLSIFDEVVITVDILINAANVLYVFSYFVKDVLRIRVLTVVAAILLVSYFLLQPEPVMTIIYWNTFFILLNILQIVRIKTERRTGRDPVDFPMNKTRQFMARVKRCGLRYRGVGMKYRKPKYL